MIKTAKYLATFLELLHGIASIAALIVIIALMINGTVKGALLEGVFNTGAVYDKENDTAVVRELNIYGLDIKGVYQPYYSHYYENSENFQTGESYFYHRLDYMNCEYNTAAAAVFAVGSFIILVLMTLVFELIHNILESADGQKPRFKKDVPTMLKYAGILLILVSLVCLGTSFIADLLTHAGKINTNDVAFTMGLFMICLSRFFDYGTKLEQDAEELV